MLSFAPISSSAISALPDELLRVLSGVFRGVVTYSAVPYTPYQQLLSSGNRIMYAVAINIRAVR